MLLNLGCAASRLKLSLKNIRDRVAVGYINLPLQFVLITIKLMIPQMMRGT
jgi:uncharacterized protein with HEPN domain